MTKTNYYKIKYQGKTIIASGNEISILQQCVGTVKILRKATEQELSTNIHKRNF